jgi:hypothetical protein
MRNKWLSVRGLKPPQRLFRSHHTAPSREANELVRADLELVPAPHVLEEADPKEAAHHDLEWTAVRFDFSG